MKKNMGTIDRAARIASALAIAVLYVNGNISGLAAAVLGAIAVVFTVSSIAGFCLAYTPFGISTRRERAAAADGG